LKGVQTEIKSSLLRIERRLMKIRKTCRGLHAFVAFFSGKELFFGKSFIL